MRRIRRLSVHQFRSYTSLALPLDGRSIVLTGPNGAGKTNLLEALSFISAGRGLRGATLFDAMQQGGDAAQGWGVGIHLQDDDENEPVVLNVRAQPPSPFRKVIKVDGVTKPSASDAMEYVRFSWATPAQDRLFLDGPSERRRFIDRMTLAHDTAHAKTAGAYEMAMRQRQAALAEPRPDPSVLNSLENQMAEAGIAMAAARRATASLLAAGYGFLRSGAFPAAQLSLEGEVETILATTSASDAEDMMAARLHTMRGQDAAAGRALFGPHRSDLHVTHREKGQPAKNCSTGEQKALLIGLILAHAAALKSGSPGPLVLLLDEIAAHLDSARRRALADILETLGCQVIMTGTDAELFDAWGERAQRLTVINGTVQPH